MLRLTENKGFTLVELAIVLVIIGIILGAVIKGQDLIDNARAKKFASEIKAWEIAVWNFFDRKGRLPGDAKKDGIIGDDNDDKPWEDIVNAKFQNPPNDSFNLGGNTFYVYLGSSGTTNYLIVCKNASCDQEFDTSKPLEHSAIMYFESFDAYIDGEADASKGNVRKITSAVTIDSSKKTFTSLALESTSASWFPDPAGAAGYGLAMTLR